MKKRFLALIICICAICTAVVSAAGGSTQDSTLITKSYLEGTYLQELLVMISDRTLSATGNLGKAAIDRLNTLGQAYIEHLQPKEEPESSTWITSADFISQNGKPGDTVTLAAGTGLIWTSGSARVSGTLIDVTTGKEMLSGQLTPQHRYVAAGECTIAILENASSWFVEGQWRMVVAPHSFIDLTDDWYQDAVCYVVERGLFQGVSDTQFAPKRTMTRGMLSTVLYRMAGSPEVIFDSRFSDVLQDSWFMPGALWAAQNHIANSTGDGSTFSPNRDLTRQEIAMMLYNYANYLGRDTSARGDLTTFVDAGTIPEWAVDAFSWAVSIGLVQGDASARLSPTDTSNRAQVAVLLQRFEQWLENT